MQMSEDVQSVQRTTMSFRVVLLYCHRWCIPFSNSNLFQPKLQKHGLVLICKLN